MITSIWQSLTKRLLASDYRPCLSSLEHPLGSSTGSAFSTLTGNSPCLSTTSTSWLHSWSKSFSSSTFWGSLKLWVCTYSLAASWGSSPHCKWAYTVWWIDKCLALLNSRSSWMRLHAGKLSTSLSKRYTSQGSCNMLRSWVPWSISTRRSAASVIRSPGTPIWMSLAARRRQSSTWIQSSNRLLNRSATSLRKLNSYSQKSIELTHQDSEVFTSHSGTTQLWHGFSALRISSIEMTVVPCSRDSWVKSSVIEKKRLSKSRSRWTNRGLTCKIEDLTSHQVLPLWSKGKRRQMIANRLQTWSTSSTMALSQVKMNQPFRALNHNLVSVSNWQKETTKTRVGTETMRQQISSLVTIVLISKMLNSK